jgi:hypothetical protein
MEKPFYYKRGKFETETYWIRPTHGLIKRFLVDLQENTDIFKKYKISLIGKILIDISNTWDVDIQMYNIDGSGDIPSELENDMNIMYHYGIDRNRVLPDISWVNCKLENISKDDYISGNYTQFNHKRVKTTNIVKIINGETVLNNSEPVNGRTIFLNKDLVLTEDDIWPNFNTVGFKTDPRHRLEDYFILENQVQYYDALDFIKSTPHSFFTETNPLYRKTSKIM